MATRSRIAVKVGDIYRSIYCHWDGYPSNQFPILTKHYATQEAAELLVSFGDASSLGERCVPLGVHSYGAKEEGCTVYYGRDRGEEGTEYRETVSLKQISPEEYIYVFEGGVWRWSHGRGDSGRWFTTVDGNNDD